MLKATQIRNGMVILHNGKPHKVVYFKHTVTGRGSASIPVRLRNVIDGSTAEVSYRSDDKVEKAYIDEKEMEFLYHDADEFWFMDTGTYEQISLKREDVEEIAGYLAPNIGCKVQLYEGSPIGVTPPNTVQLKVTDTEPSIKGATASGNVTKSAVLETGLSIQVPMFVETGDVVIVNTVSGEYQGRPGRG
jgi:elongation factor P